MLSPSTSPPLLSKGKECRFGEPYNAQIRRVKEVGLATNNTILEAWCLTLILKPKRKMIHNKKPRWSIFKDPCR